MLRVPYLMLASLVRGLFAAVDGRSMTTVHILTGILSYVGAAVFLILAAFLVIFGVGCVSTGNAPGGYSGGVYTGS